MSQWPSAKAKRVLAALMKIGWTIKRQTGSHRTLSRPGWQDVIFAFHDGEELGAACWRVSQNTQGSHRMTFK
jgi:predicted RNA binding protein YcfA (HicA-like mRNA interferase family)